MLDHDWVPQASMIVLREVKSHSWCLNRYIYAFGAIWNDFRKIDLLTFWDQEISLVPLGGVWGRGEGSKLHPKLL